MVRQHRPSFWGFIRRDLFGRASGQQRIDIGVWLPFPLPDDKGAWFDEGGTQWKAGRMVVGLLARDLAVVCGYGRGDGRVGPR
jgi:hypothetical protein